MFKNIYYMYYSLIKINGNAKLSTFIKYLKKMESVVSIWNSWFIKKPEITSKCDI